jgi:hypothetical protein
LRLCIAWFWQCLGRPDRSTSMRDSAIDQPAQHWARTESRICNQLFGINIMAILYPLQQGTH